MTVKGSERLAMVELYRTPRRQEDVSRRVALLVLPEPLREHLQPLRQRRPGGVAEFGLGAGDVGEGALDVAGLGGLAVDDRLLANGGFEFGDEGGERSEE